VVSGIPGWLATAKLVQVLLALAVFLIALARGRTSVSAFRRSRRHGG
jgi:hypothetical protein